MNTPVEKHIESIECDVGCLTFVVIVFAIFFGFSVWKHGSTNKLLAEQNETLKQILQYKEQSK
jgi:uncharacterized membrane protein affecting hemolysin expression